MNVAFTYQGMEAMELPGSTLESFEPEYRDGMRSRASYLRDTGHSDPSRWDPEWLSGDIHIMVIINALHQSALEERLRWLEEVSEELGGVAEVARQEGHSLPDWAEHFGFNDGFGQPSIDGTDDGPDSGKGRIDKLGRWHPIKPGEFILGYGDEEAIIPPAPIPDALSNNSTYLVYRKLYQDVACFRRLLGEQGRRFPGGEARLAAKIVGRWQDGTPLSVSPEQPVPGMVDDPQRASNFRYGDDPDGLKCPRGAHIRRANPRDVGGTTVRRHRLIRRGLPYGDPLPAGEEDDGQDRGLIFISFQANILRQFEFIQAEWLDNGNPFNLGDDRDVIAGHHDGSGKMVVPGKPPRFLHPIPPLVQTRGGEYFFLPGINGLRWLASEPGARSGTTRAPRRHRSFAHEFESSAGRFRDDLAGLGREAVSTLERHEEEHPQDVFAALRHVRPVLQTHGLTVVTRHRDILEILRRKDAFSTSLYESRFARLTGAASTGDEAAVHFEESAPHLPAGIEESDASRIEALSAETAAESTAVALARGKLDVVLDLADRIPARVAAEYLGIPGPDAETLIGWSRILFNEVFVNLRGESAVTARAEAAADEMRSYIDNLISVRDRVTTPGAEEPADVLGGLLRISTPGGQEFDRAWIRAHLMRLVILLVPTTSKALALAIEEMLRRPQSLAAAQAAARDGHEGFSERVLFEAMRFAPVTHGVYRLASAEHRLSTGPGRAVLVPANATVFLATQSALLDSAAVAHPHRFDPDREDQPAVSLGLGVYGHFARFAHRAILPKSAHAMLALPDFRRAPGADGQLQFLGPFPDRLVVDVASP